MSLILCGLLVHHLLIRRRHCSLLVSLAGLSHEIRRTLFKIWGSLLYICLLLWRCKPNRRCHRLLMLLLLTWLRYRCYLLLCYCLLLQDRLLLLRLLINRLSLRLYCRVGGQFMRHVRQNVGIDWSRVWIRILLADGYMLVVEYWCRLSHEIIEPRLIELGIPLI
jgi:hypothetical protein